MKILFFSVVLSISSYAQGNLLKELGLASSEKNGPKDDTTNPCLSPRAALRASLEGMGEEKIACFEKNKSSASALYTVADRLNVVLKSNESEIDVEEAPTTAHYRDGRNLKRYLVVAEEPEIYLVREDGSWIFPKASIAAINEHYANSLRFNLMGLYDYAPQWATKDIFGIKNFNLLQIFLVLVFLCIAVLIRFVIAWVAHRQMAKIFNYLSEQQTELKKISRHFGNLAMAGVLVVLIPALDLNLGIVHYLNITIRLFASLSLVIVLYNSVGIVAYFIKNRSAKLEKIDTQIISLMSTGLKVIICVLGSILILQAIHINATSLLAGVTIGGLAFSFAARDTVANLFGSITVFTDRAFSIGDWIKISEVEGIVEYIGFRSTRIRTFTDSLVSMPNSKFTDSFVENFSVRNYRRTTSELTITNSTKPQQIEAFCNGIRAIINAHPHTRKDNYEVHFSAFEPSNIKIMLYFFSAVSSWSAELRVRHEIYLDILRLAEKLAIQFSSPTKIYLSSIDELKKDEDHTATEDELKEVVKDFGPSGKNAIKPGPRLGEGYFAGQK